MLRCSSTRRISPFFPLVVAGLLLLAGCGNEPAPKAAPVARSGDHEGEEGHHHHSHGEKGPHNGALVAIGDDAAHLEVVLDAETGKVTVYVLDGEARNPIPIKADKLEIAFTKEHEHDHDEAKEGEKPADDELPETGTLVLAAVEPGADGMTSVYAGESESLKGADEFDAVLTSISIAGKEYAKVKFNYPEGNEHDHHHH